VPCGSAPAVVAIPARDEHERIGDCLAALALQRDRAGFPIAAGTFDVLVLANDCGDETARSARSYAGRVPFGLHVVECRLPPGEAHAGGARRVAMEQAATLLTGGGNRTGRLAERDGIILTTDADSRVQPTWMAANLAAFETGVDAVAGYVDAGAGEYLALGAEFLDRGRLEDCYLAYVARLYAALDPRRHDPWPNHRVHSGASFAVTLSAYRAIGGLPSRGLGEDAALALALESAGFLIRHTMDAVVTTSCRFDSRTPGGAGDTMRQRYENLDATCDGDMEPVERVFRRARTKGLLRRLHAAGRLGDDSIWQKRLAFDRTRAAHILEDAANLPFARLWQAVESESSALRLGDALRPSDLPFELRKAERLLRHLAAGRSADPAGISAHGETSMDGAAASLS